MRCSHASRSASKDVGAGAQWWWCGLGRGLCSAWAGQSKQQMHDSSIHQPALVLCSSVMASVDRPVRVPSGPPSQSHPSEGRALKKIAGRLANAGRQKNTLATYHELSPFTHTNMGGKPSEKSPKVEKSSKKDKSSKKSKKDEKSSVEKQDKVAKAAAASLLADKKAVNPVLSSLFAAQVCIPRELRART